MSRRLPAALALAATVFLAACGGGGESRADDEPADPNTVILDNNEFKPSKLTVKTGTRVTWEWRENVAHNVNGGDAFKSKLVSKGTYSHTFATAGSFDYKCDVHPTMKGTVTVE